MRKLLQSHEDERTSIVRELHKYIDSLILLSFELDRILENAPQSLAPTRREIRNVREQVEELFGEIQTLLDCLRPPKVQFLGLSEVAASLCRDFSVQNNLPIDFESDNVPDDLPLQVKLSLFHVLQEALQNAAAHGGSQRVHVSLRGGTNQLDLFVRDSGNGFAPDAACEGCGLTIMNERMKMVNGDFSVDSLPQLGTTIYARVPLKQQAISAATG